jgi:hypothetical protein
MWRPWPTGGRGGGSADTPKKNKKKENKSYKAELVLIPVDEVKHLLCRKTKFDSTDFTKAVHCTNFNLSHNTTGGNENMKIIVCVLRSWTNKRSF